MSAQVASKRYLNKEVDWCHCTGLSSWGLAWLDKLRSHLALGSVDVSRVAGVALASSTVPTPSVSPTAEVFPIVAIVLLRAR
jgi:hypothetical protein